jgi:hypothetical protein
VKCGIWEQNKVHVLYDGPGQFVPKRADKGCVVDGARVGGGDFLGGIRRIERDEGGDDERSR